MKPIVIVAALVVLALVVVAVGASRRQSGCKSDPDCPLGQRCRNGACVSVVSRPKVTGANCGSFANTLGWYDAQGQGVSNDYCRYIINADGTSRFSCVLAGQPGKNVDKTPAEVAAFAKTCQSIVRGDELSCDPARYTGGDTCSRLPRDAVTVFSAPEGGGVVRMDCSKYPNRHIFVESAMWGPADRTKLGAACRDYDATNRIVGEISQHSDGRTYALAAGNMNDMVGDPCSGVPKQLIGSYQCV